MIKINNVTIPTPSNYSIGIMDLSKSERNANGTMVIERIATKRKIELNYNFITQTDLATLLQAVANTFFTVEYPDSQTGVRTGTFYVGDRTADGLDYKSGVMRWQNAKFNLIER
jgi:hypothetical protein